MQVERELQDLRERLSQVEQWKQRREEIELELAKVWTGAGEPLSPPPYVEEEAHETEDEDSDTAEFVEAESG